ncbi:DnaA regulatory inactivator HdaA [Chelativorans sp. AA-79]|uniref:DnaA regulatory inactivator HdaA n=1 Tax=Chelativorans sp. AA-79 TaxID=3028735 RepID=UPI0023F67AFC|nr:DnaA regulatory inactivator HdaA [Chelativorans sp. AA-79]WEX07592.1 DnaA regulatory inactivator HdaA [Chelativorans sp. AA-79]
MPKEQAPRQLPLELAHAEARSRDDLVVAPANEHAVALVENWPDWPAPVVVLAGPEGSGKTHLADIWCGHSGAYPASATGIDAEAIAAAEHGPVLIDDADSPLLDETGLFHLVNTIRGADTHLLLTARHLPSAWGVKLPDLLSRLRAAAAVEIREPDEMLLAGVIVKLFSDRQVTVEPHVVQFILRRMERSLSAARRVVETLDRVALERKTRISRALAAEVLAGMETSQGRLDV